MGGGAAARARSSVFAMRGQEVLKLALELRAGNPTRVAARERVIARIPGDWGLSNTALTESCGGTLLAAIVWMAVAGEFAKHPCWWRDYTIPFRGGGHPQPNEDAGVKVMDSRDGTVRALEKERWWHAAGNGRSGIGILHGRTTRAELLTKDHRVYGRGAHPEVAGIAAASRWRSPRRMAARVGIAGRPIGGNRRRFACV